MTNCQNTTNVLPEYVATESLNAPFEVVLKNSVSQTIDPSGKIVKTTIPNLKGLLKKIAITRLVVARKLSGPEIKFIRKALAIKAGDLADMISVTPEHLSRCEAGERVLSPGAEKCLRLTVLLDMLKLPDGAEGVCENNDELKKMLDKFRQRIRRLQELIKEMQIPAVYDASEEIVLSFVLGDMKDQLVEDTTEPTWDDANREAA